MLLKIMCVYHQNVKLMIDACKFKSDQHSLTDKIVCDRQHCDCMIHRCDQCPRTEPPDTDESDQDEEEEERKSGLVSGYQLIVQISLNNVCQYLNLSIYW